MLQTIAFFLPTKKNFGVTLSISFPSLLICCISRMGVEKTKEKKRMGIGKKAGGFWERI